MVQEARKRLLRSCFHSCEGIAIGAWVVKICLWGSLTDIEVLPSYDVALSKVLRMFRATKVNKQQHMS